MVNHWKKNKMIEYIIPFLITMNMTDIDTFLFVDEMVEEYLIYEYSYKERSIEKVLTTGIADCTGRAKLKKVILDEYGIKTRLVHGYCNGYKHDWIEVRINGKYMTNEEDYCTEEFIKVGYGVW